MASGLPKIVATPPFPVTWLGAKSNDIPEGTKLASTNLAWVFCPVTSKIIGVTSWFTQTSWVVAPDAPLCVIVSCGITVIVPIIDISVGIPAIAELHWLIVVIS